MKVHTEALVELDDDLLIYRYAIGNFKGEGNSQQPMARHASGA